jgi:hypothetical protein
VFVKAHISSRPSGQLMHVPGAELGRQITRKARSQSHNEGQAQPLAGDLANICVTPAETKASMTLSWL